MQAGARVVGRQVLEALTAFVPGMQLIVLFWLFPNLYLLMRFLQKRISL